MGAEYSSIGGGGGGGGEGGKGIGTKKGISTIGMNAYERYQRGESFLGSEGLGQKVSSAIRAAGVQGGAQGLVQRGEALLRMSDSMQASWLLSEVYGGDVELLIRHCIAYAQMGDGAMVSRAAADGLALAQGRSEGPYRAPPAMDATDWLTYSFPLLMRSTVEPLLRSRLTGQTFSPVWQNPLRSLSTSAADSEGLLMRPEVAWALSLSAENAVQPWAPLYASRKHGTSFSRFVHHVRGYDGPTVVLVENAADGELFGAYVAGGWRDQVHYFGNGRCFLFRVRPSWAVFRPSGVDSAYVYLNAAEKHAFPMGLGFGGDLRAPRLWLDPSFEKGRSLPIDTTYSRGSITRNLDFAVSAVEVWGCGGSVAEQAQARAREEESKFMEQRRKVDRGKFAEGWQNGPDKWMMDMMGRTGASDAFTDELKKDPRQVLDSTSNPSSNQP